MLKFRGLPVAMFLRVLSRDVITHWSTRGDIFVSSLTAMLKPMGLPVASSLTAISKPTGSPRGNIFVSSLVVMLKFKGSSVVMFLRVLSRQC